MEPWEGWRAWLVRKGPRGLVLLLALGAIGAFLVTVGLRAGYPFDLEWMEGGILTHGMRLLEGKALYGPPSGEFIPFIYPPLHTLVLAATMALFGQGYEAGRGLSLLAVAICSILLFNIARREGRSPLLGLVAVGMFLATYERFGAWLDLVRVDSLYLALILAGCVAATQIRHLTLAALASALLLSLAALTKQSALVFIPALLPWFHRRGGMRAALIYLAMALAIWGSFTLALVVITDGWYWTYTISIPQGHPLIWSFLLYRALLEIGQALPVVVLAILLWLTHSHLMGPRTTFSPWGAVALAAMASSVLMRAHSGSYYNAFLACGLFLPILLVRAIRTLDEGLPSNKTGWFWRAWAYGAVALQFCLLSYDPRELIPTSRDVEAGQRLISILKTLDGPVLMPNHPYYPVMAGKGYSFHMMALHDTSRSRLFRYIPPDLSRAIGRKVYSAVVLGSDGFVPPRISTHYANTARLFLPPGALAMRSGHQLHPTTLHLPQRQGAEVCHAVEGTFETGVYRGWEEEGQAFAHGPVPGAVGDQAVPQGYQGAFLVNSLHPELQRKAKGRLLSRPFTPCSKSLTFLVGGSYDPKACAVRLVTAEGKVLRAATGNDSLTLRPVRWDLAGLEGMRLQVEVVDESAEGIVLFDSLAAVDP